MLVGAETLIQEKKVSLAVAGKQAFGNTGLVFTTIAAAFSIGSAFNATLFSTGRLMEIVAKKKDLPHLFSLFFNDLQSIHKFIDNRLCILTC